MQRELNLRQLAYVHEYIANGGNATRAYMSVYGVKGAEQASKQSERLMKDERVQSVLSHEKALISAQVCKQASAQVFDSREKFIHLQEVTEKKQRFNESIRCVEGIAKIDGLMSDKQDHSGEIILRVIREERTQ